MSRGDLALRGREGMFPKKGFSPASQTGSWRTVGFALGGVRGDLSADVCTLPLEGGGDTGRLDCLPNKIAGSRGSCSTVPPSMTKGSPEFPDFELSVEGPVGKSIFGRMTISSSKSLPSSCSLAEPMSLSVWRLGRFLDCSTLGGGLGSEAREADRFNFLRGGAWIGEESNIAREILQHAPWVYK